MALFSWGPAGRGGRTDRSIAGSLISRGHVATHCNPADVSSNASEREQEQAGVDLGLEQAPVSGVNKAPARFTSVNAAPSQRKAASKGKRKGKTARLGVPVDILTCFPGCIDQCEEKQNTGQGSKKRKKQLSGQLQEDCSDKRRRLMSGSNSEGSLSSQVVELEDSKELTPTVAPIRTTPHRSSDQRCKYTRARAEQLMGTLLSARRFGRTSLAEFEGLFCRVTGCDFVSWGNGERKPKGWYRVQFERMLKSGKRLVLIDPERCEFELRGWLEKEGEGTERLSATERDSSEEQMIEIDLMSEDAGTFQGERESEAGRVSDAKEEFEAEGVLPGADIMSCSKLDTDRGAFQAREALLESALVEIKARLIAAEAAAAAAERRAAELQLESEVKEACFEGRVSWLEGQLSASRASLVAAEARATATEASLCDALPVEAGNMAKAEALRIATEARYLEQGEELERVDALRESAEARLLEQGRELLITKKERDLAEERVLAVQREHASCGERLRRARKGRAVASSGAAATRRRVDQLVWERCELADQLRSAREGCETSTHRAAASEQRAVLAESRLASLEEALRASSDQLIGPRNRWAQFEKMTSAADAAAAPESKGTEAESREGASSSATNELRNKEEGSPPFDQGTTWSFARDLTACERQLLEAYTGPEASETMPVKMKDQAGAWMDALCKAEGAMVVLAKERVFMVLEV